MTKDIKNVYALISAVTKDLCENGITKDRKNQQQGYAFRGIDDVYNSLSPILSKHGLIILPRVLARESVERTTKSGGALFYSFVEVEYDFISSHDGSSHTVKTFGEAMDSADKSTNKAMSAAFKYACIQAFCIPTEGDNDADGHTHEVVTKKAPAKPDKPEIEMMTGGEFVALQKEIKGSKSNVELAEARNKANAAKARMTKEQSEVIRKEIASKGTELVLAETNTIIGAG